MKKGIALFLVICMLSSLMGVSALAADDTTLFIRPSCFSNHLGTWRMLAAPDKDSILEVIAGADSSPDSTIAAAVAIDLPASGTYTVWANTRDFTSSPGNRYCNLQINDTYFDKIIGNTGKDEWAWEKLGTVQLEKGETILRLHDTGGYWARVQGIILSTDENLKLPNVHSEMADMIHATEVKILDIPIADIKPNGSETETNDTKIDYKTDKTYIILSPESFEKNVGRWTLTKNDVGGYVSTYLKGATNSESGGEANPAVHKITLPKDGNYKILALSRDYSTKAGSRYFDIQIGDYAAQRLGSHCEDGWGWQSTTLLPMFAGDYDLKLIDSSGSYARFAMLIITDDEDFEVRNTSEFYTALKNNLYKDGMYTANISNTPDANRPQSEIAVKLNGSYMQFDVDPVLMNDRTMVPFRAIFEALGCSVSWDDETQTATGFRNGKTVKLVIDSNQASVDGKIIKLDQPAVLLNDRTLVPLRFVSESLNASVKWTDETQTVTILASIPEDVLYWFRPSSFSSIGTWSFDRAADGAFESTAFQGTTPSVSDATIKDADASNTKPATAIFNVSEAGEYNLWVRSRDFSQNQQGDRYFNLAVNGNTISQKFGTHGGDGYKWAKAPQKVALKQGKNQLELLDTSGFYARCDSILFCKNDHFVPPESLSGMQALAAPMPTGTSDLADFPRYAKELAEPIDSVALENADTKVVFYKVPTSHGQVVQNEIYSKDASGNWVRTNNRDEEFGYLVVQADTAQIQTSQDLYTYQTTYTDANGASNSYFGLNPYLAGRSSWFIPTDYQVDGNNVTLLFNQPDFASLSVVWTLETDNKAPLVSATVTAPNAGYYTIAGWEGGEFAEDDFTDAIAPFRVIQKRVHEEIATLNEQFLYTPMGCYTLTENNKYGQAPVTKGVVAESSWIPLRWVYKDNGILGINMKSPNGGYKGTIFAPVLGSDESNLAANESYTVQYRVISSVSNWFDNYKFVAQDLFDITDYRQNTYASLNEAIFNTRKLMLDDKYGGWDSISKGHYNMEGMNTVSEANPMQAIQDYLLTEDSEMLEKRAIPTLAAFLTRPNLHFNRKGEVSGQSYWAKLTEPENIGTPRNGFNLNVTAGLYEMTRGNVPYLYDLGLKKGTGNVVNEYGSVAPFSNNLNLYIYTGNKEYLNKAIAQADEYLEKVVYASSSTLPAWETFIYISYYPNLGSLIDIYEVTKDKKYLDAAEHVAQQMLTGLWVPGIDNDKKTQQVEVNSLNTFRLHGNEYATGLWWAGDKQFRIGRENGLKDLSGNAAMDAKHGYVDSWIPSRVGLGLEQSSTFAPVSSNIVMQYWAGDFIKLADYTGEEMFATAARNAIIGRFANYSGYYQTGYITMQQYPEYPYEGPDYTSIYWHHIPPFLAMLEDFLINQTQAWSGSNIKFPALRQQGYAYFNSNQYGHKPGVFYDQNDMWLWLDEGMVDTGNLQIDWLAARKNGMFGLALMNESAEDITTTVSLLDKIPGGATYTGTASVFDKTGNKSEISVQNGKFEITIPAKALRALTIAIPEVKEPSFASSTYTLNGTSEIGATVTNHKNGKAYALQLSPKEYFAYVYVTDKPATTKSVEMTYSIGNGEQKKVTATEYPFEFIIKVDDASKEFQYELEVTAVSGNKTNAGSGTLMPKSLSDQKGMKYTEAESAGDVSSADVTVEYKGSGEKFTPFDIAYTAQGSNHANGELRFVVPKASVPLSDTSSQNLTGLPVRGQLIDGSKTVEMDTVITGVETRQDSIVIIVADVPNVRASQYAKSDGMPHVFKLKVYPHE